jgi:hypothetical protein
VRRRKALVALVGLATTLGAAIAGVALGEPPAGRAPDPPAPSTAKQWLFELSANRGAVRLDRASSVTAKAPIATARVIGRYAIELYVGRELLDRVRFDVPLTAEGPPEKDPKRPFARPTFETVTAKLRVQMADSPRAAWGVLIDRATGEIGRFWWPPEPDGRLAPMTFPAASAPATDAGTTDAGATDAGTTDAAAPDGGAARTERDAGAPDAAAPRDAGADAG